MPWALVLVCAVITALGLTLIVMAVPRDSDQSRAAICLTPALVILLFTTIKVVFP